MVTADDVDFFIEFSKMQKSKRPRPTSLMLILQPVPDDFSETERLLLGFRDIVSFHGGKRTVQKKLPILHCGHCSDVL
jgi:hypothetical protein